MAVRNRQALRSFLEGEQARLKVNLVQMEATEGTNLGYGNHMADDASEAFEQAKDLALRQNTERLLQQVESALKRFERGSYGLCEKCGAEIDPARLEALPSATLCLHCQQRLGA